VWIAYALVIAVGVASVALLLALLLAVIRHVKALAGSLSAYQEEVLPVLERIRDEAERAGTHAGRLSVEAPRAVSRDGRPRADGQPSGNGRR